jgi:hypothetical protein
VFARLQQVSSAEFSCLRDRSVAVISRINGMMIRSRSYEPNQPGMDSTAPHPIDTARNLCSPTENMKKIKYFFQRIHQFTTSSSRSTLYTYLEKTSLRRNTLRVVCRSLANIVWSERKDSQAFENVHVKPGQELNQSVYFQRMNEHIPATQAVGPLHPIPLKRTINIKSRNCVHVYVPRIGQRHPVCRWKWGAKTS